jgi:hypothetical protein
MEILFQNNEVMKQHALNMHLRMCTQDRINIAHHWTLIDHQMILLIFLVF